MYTGSLNTTQKMKQHCKAGQQCTSAKRRGHQAAEVSPQGQAGGCQTFPSLPLNTGKVASQDDDTVQLNHLLMTCRG